MEPKEVIGDRPVELKWSVGAGLKFETVLKAVKAEMKPEFTSARTIYFPRIIASGPPTRTGYWDFLAGEGQYLHVDRELRLLVGAPPGATVLARFQLRARVGLAGVPGAIPLLARTGGIDETYRLA